MDTHIDVEHSYVTHTQWLSSQSRQLAANQKPSQNRLKINFNSYMNRDGDETSVGIIGHRSRLWCLLLCYNSFVYTLISGTTFRSNICDEFSLS